MFFRQIMLPSPISLLKYFRINLFKNALLYFRLTHVASDFTKCVQKVCHLDKCDAMTHTNLSQTQSCPQVRFEQKFNRN